MNVATWAPLAGYVRACRNFLNREGPSGRALFDQIGATYRDAFDSLSVATGDPEAIRHVLATCRVLEGGAKLAREARTITEAEYRGVLSVVRTLAAAVVDLAPAEVGR